MSHAIGGERPKRPEDLQSPILREHGRDAAQHCFRRCYETWPELDEKFGERGRRYVAEDAYWHLEHLDAALAVDSPSVFASYADWLTSMLRSRGVGPDQVAGAFGFLAESLGTVPCPPADAAQLAALLGILRDNQARIQAIAQAPETTSAEGP